MTVNAAFTVFYILQQPSQNATPPNDSVTIRYTKPCPKRTYLVIQSQ